ncbi:MAG TPA: hypothetical protein VKC62_10170 [Gaiellaceae bacterium]|nr:hypothetical protein [Gaiellaceae bacterium]
MSLFRPARTVTSPSGDYWELYVSKTALPAWRGSDADDAVDVSGYGSAQFDVLELPVMVLAFFWANLILPLARVVLMLPVAVVRGRRSRAVRIEALRTFPRREVLLWTTTDGHAPRVLDEIAAGLSQGKIVRPVGSVYTGPE